MGDHGNPANKNGQLKINKVQPINDVDSKSESLQDDSEAKEQEYRDREPWRYVTWITGKPKTWFGRFRQF